jgi:hypothetical protein
MRRLRLAGLFLFAIGFALMVYLIVQYVYAPQQSHAGFSFTPIIGVVLFGAGLWLDNLGRKPRKH